MASINKLTNYSFKFICLLDRLYFRQAEEQAYLDGAVLMSESDPSIDPWVAMLRGDAVIMDRLIKCCMSMEYVEKLSVKELEEVLTQLGREYKCIQHLQAQEMEKYGKKDPELTDSETEIPNLIRILEATKQKLSQPENGK